MPIKVFSQDVELHAAPIRPDWVMGGQPTARSAVLARSADRTALTALWDCSAGRFRWDYREDETIHVLEGAATLTFGDGRVERLAPGVVVFFPAGASAVWEVDGYIRKLAVFRQPMPPPVALSLRAWWRLRARVGALRRRVSAFAPALLPAGA